MVQVLNLIGTAVASACPVDAEGLVLSVQGPNALVPAPVSEELVAMEDFVVERLSETVSPGTPPRMLLLGPRTSKTDPLYALRFLAKLGLKTETPGTLEVHDVYTHPEIASYYNKIPWNGHSVVLNLGSAGRWEKLRDSEAHLILAIHPGVGLEEMLPLFSRNLARGGLAVMQHTIHEEFSGDDDYRFLLEAALMICQQGDLDLAAIPVRRHVFRSLFSERYDDVQALIFQKLS